METKASEKSPLLFLGHGSPMNAIEDNEFVRSFMSLGKKLEKPKAILCISAHWETRGTCVTSAQMPETIHDFGGFPEVLYEIQYPAPGSPELANRVKDLISATNVGLDERRGLDHGAWSVIKHLYPEADIPLVQLSLDYTQPAQYHFELGKQLSKLRDENVLIIGSGNIVHNLRLAAWGKLNEQFAYGWAADAGKLINDLIINENYSRLINYHLLGEPVKLAVPTPEHFLPLLYILSLKERGEKVTIFNDKPVAGSLTMTSVKIGKN